MCGRFTLTVETAELQETFPEVTFPAGVTPRFNIAPGQPILVLPNDGTCRADFFLWGLVPSWAKDPTLGSRLINARAETPTTKPAFRAAFRYRRGLIFADGFFEWQASGLQKTPYFIYMKSGRPFAFAGLWEIWQGADGSLIKSAAIITTEPNELIARIHRRMPVILKPEDYEHWLSPTPPPLSVLQKMLSPYPASEMEAYPILPLVNNPENEGPEVIRPASPRSEMG